MRWERWERRQRRRRWVRQGRRRGWRGQRRRWDRRRGCRRRGCRGRGCRGRRCRRVVAAAARRTQSDGSRDNDAQRDENGAKNGHSHTSFGRESNTEQPLGRDARACDARLDRFKSHSLFFVLRVQVLKRPRPHCVRTVLIITRGRGTFILLGGGARATPLPRFVTTTTEPPFAAMRARKPRALQRARLVAGAALEQRALQPAVADGAQSAQRRVAPRTRGDVAGAGQATRLCVGLGVEADDACDVAAMRQGSRLGFQRTRVSSGRAQPRCKSRDCPTRHCNQSFEMQVEPNPHLI